MKPLTVASVIALTTLGLIALEPINQVQAQNIPQTTPVASTDLGSRSKTQDRVIIAELLVDSLATQQFPSANKRLSPQLSTLLSPDILSNYWQELTRVTGQFVNRHETQVDGNLVLVTVEFENVTDTLFVIFDDQGNIVGLDFPQQ